MQSARQKAADMLPRDVGEAVGSLCDVAEAHCSLGRLDKAYEMVRECSALLESGRLTPPERLKALLRSTAVLIAYFFCTNSQADYMLSLAEQAKLCAEAAKDEAAIADSLSLLGQAAYFADLNAASTLGSPQDAYGKALSYQEESLKRRKALADSRGIAESVFYIGLVHERRQEFELAAGCYTKARKLAGEHGHLFEKCEATRHLGGISWHSGDLDRALSYAMEALTLREQMQFRLYLPFDHILVGQICLAKGNPDSALDHFRRAFELSAEMQLKQTLLYSQLGLGDACLSRNELSEAKANFGQALALAEELRIPRAVSRALERLKSIGKD